VAKPSGDSIDKRWYAVLATLGVEMVAPIGLGIYLDSQFGTTPWLSIIGVGFGFIGSMMHLTLALRAANREDENKPQDQQ
jgi:F0F1-type ATP synthase assembly protein I